MRIEIDQSGKIENTNRPTVVGFSNSETGKSTKKANCDVDMTFDMMRYMGQYSGLVALTGDGDFAPVLAYLKYHGRDIKILARGERAAKEIRQLAGDEFRDFNYLRELLKFESKE